MSIGAIALCNLIKGESYEEKFQRLLALTRKLANDSNIYMDEAVFLSEKNAGNKNRSLAFLLKAHGLLKDDVKDVLDLYFKACSISVTTKNLATIGSAFANGGKLPGSKVRLFSGRYAHYVNAVMMICGMYEGSGNFAVDVGIPAKSGISGGIMASVPTRFGVGIFSPALDNKGNSAAGVQALKHLSNQMCLSIF